MLNQYEAELGRRIDILDDDDWQGYLIWGERVHGIQWGVPTPEDCERALREMLLPRDLPPNIHEWSVEAAAAERKLADLRARL